MSVWEGWDLTDEYSSVPILSMGCGDTAKNRITRPKDDAQGVANSDEAGEVDVHQNQSNKAEAWRQET